MPLGLSETGCRFLFLHPLVTCAEGGDRNVHISIASDGLNNTCHGNQTAVAPSVAEVCNVNPAESEPQDRVNPLPVRDADRRGSITTGRTRTSRRPLMTGRKLMPLVKDCGVTVRINELSTAGPMLLRGCENS